MMTRYGAATVHQLPCLQDNYAFVLRDEESGIVATIDTPDPDVIATFLDSQGWGLDLILNTHWHADHVGGNMALKERFGATIFGPKAEGDKITGRDHALSDADTVTVGNLEAKVMATPGHTLGHIIYIFDTAGIAFVGDTLFSLGCGRLFEGTPEMMWRSLASIRALSAEMVIHCAHEYTEANGRFAVTIAPDNAALATRYADVLDRRGKGLPTVPVRLGDEIAANPFLRADDPVIAAHLGLTGAAPAEVFAEIRRRKDHF